MIFVCPLSRMPETVSKSGAQRLVTLINAETGVDRPAQISAENYLRLSVNDIWEAHDGMTLPGEVHMRQLLDFATAWDRVRPMVIHCYAGVSRSTASAYIVASALAPARDEMELARELRWLSPSATPNPRMIALADTMLGREGRMIEAIKSIGRGADAFEGVPFSLSIDSFDV